MPQTTIKCPACNQEYELDESLFGQYVNCQICGEQFRVEKEERKTRCVHCKQWFEVEEYNQTVECPHCGKRTVAAKPRYIMADDNAKADKRKQALQGAIILVVLGLIIFGVVSCFQYFRNTVRENEERYRATGDVYGAEVLCDRTIRDSVYSPSTAKITYEKKERRADGFFVLSGYIDGQNLAGAMVRNRFAAVISYNPDRREYHVEAFDITP